MQQPTPHPHTLDTNSDQKQDSEIKKTEFQATNNPVTDKNTSPETSNTPPLLGIQTKHVVNDTPDSKYTIKQHQHGLDINPTTLHGPYDTRIAGAGVAKKIEELKVAGYTDEQVANYPKTADGRNRWVRILPNTRFTDELKALYLENLPKYNCKLEITARKTGICAQTVKNHRKTDPEFKAAEESIIQWFGEEIVMTLENQFLNGTSYPIFDKEGNQVGNRVQYETPARLAMIKRFDRAYRDSSEIDINVKAGGVLVAPQSASPFDWVQQQVKTNETKSNPVGELLDITPDNQSKG